MAGLSRDAKGWRVLLQAGDRRLTIRLGRAVRERDAERFRDKVETLAAATRIGAKPDEETAAWLAKLSDRTYDRLVTLGLTSPRAAKTTVTMAELWDRFMKAKAVKTATNAVYTRVRKSLEDHFGRTCLIESIGPEQAEGWCKSLADSDLARATQSKLTHVAKSLFRRAVLWDLITKSPFEGIRPGPQTNPTRAAYIPLTDLEKILDACGSQHWRCIFALARLAALRTPSEVSGLRWADVNFETGLMTVTSPKTEHHADGAVRTVPICGRLHEVLMDAFTAADPGTVYVVPQLRHTETNLRTQAHRILARAGIPAPPKLFVNLRSSCATDWAHKRGGHVAAKWCGHSPLIALKHYAQVRPEDYEAETGRKVARPVARNRTELAGTDRQASDENRVFPVDTAACSAVREDQWAILDSNQ